MSNKLISTKFPFLPLSVHVRVTNRKQIDLQTQALIDTGFSGDIVVPATGELKQFPPDAYATWTMADGSEVLAPIFLGTIRFPQLDENVTEMVGVTITVLGDQALIGQSVLRRFTLTLANRVKILFTSVRSEADSPGQCNSIYVNTFLLKPWQLVFCLYPPWRLVELVHTG